MLFAALSLAWMLGIIVTDLLLLPLPLLITLIVGGLSSSIIARKLNFFRLVSLMVLFAGLGGLRYQIAQIPITSRSVWRLAEQGEVEIQGFVNADPKRNEEGQQVILATQKATLGAATTAVEGLLLINLPPYPAYQYGQKLLITGQINLPKTIERPQKDQNRLLLVWQMLQEPGMFDYRLYLKRKGIFALVNEPQIELLPGNVGNSLLLRLLALRDYCKAILLRLLPEPQASLAIGILLGLQASIPDEVYEAFSVTGTSHILVISGWNLSIVALLLARSAAQLQIGKNLTFWASLAALWLYTLFVGATATVVRAAVMASLAVLATATERRSETWTLLLGACFFLTVFDPQTLWDLGFQLSVFATASLFAFATPITKWLELFAPFRWAALGWVTEALAATLAAQILALPLILYNFGNLSIIAPLANVLLVPVVPHAMALGTLALLAGLIYLPFGQIVGLGAYLPLAWLTEGARILAAIPWAAIKIPPFPLWMLLLYYLLVALFWQIAIKEKGISEKK